MVNFTQKPDLFNALRTEGADPALEQALFRKLFESAPEGIVLLDNRDCIVRVNPGFLDMFGYRKDEVVGRPINSLIVDGGLDEEASDLTRRVIDHQSIRKDTVRYRKDGTMLYVSILGHPVTLGEGQVGVYGIYRDVTEQKLSEEMLRQSEDKYRTIVETIEDGYFEVDLEGNFLFFNEALPRILDCDPEALKKITYRDLCTPATAERVYDICNVVFNTGQPNPGFSWEITDRQSKSRHLETSLSLLLSSNGTPAGFHGIVRDVSERVRAETALRESEKRYRIMAENTGQLVYDYDLATGAIHWSGAIERVTGETAEALSGVDLDGWIARIHPEDRGEALALLHEAEVRGSHYHVEYRFRTRGGDYIQAEDNGTFLLDDEGKAYRMIGTMSDVSERHRVTREMAYQAAHDELTGLFNRRKFEQVLKDMLDHQRAIGRSHAVLYMDLDQFKVVNDTCGHHAGDELLRQLAVLLSNQLRKSDTLARLGGDEFGLILHGCSMVKAEEVGRKILALINEFSFSWEGRNFTIGMSIGIVDVAGHTSLAEVLMAADQACYSAKHRGRNRIQVYHFDDSDLSRHQLEIDAAAEITDALREDRFELHFQKIMLLPGHHGERHYEILLRMRDRAGELVMPDRFIPGAERYNMMSAIDRWVVSHVLQGIRRRLDAGRHQEDERFSINLSGSSFGEREFAAFVADELQRTRVPPQAIAFEITESSAILSLERAVEFIESVRALGVKVMLDDFGSGLSSFGYLKTLPIDYLKIDGELVKDIAGARIDLAMIEAIHRVGEVIGIPTVAEHVSSPEILECLREVGVQYGQGFHFHKPEPWRWG
ncbi:EAL domain-containing protein [Wenzhouxiangella sp. XN201]|uniref:EAL domain-containing protein n=1 Tax=Wenzhouxiangella sp. XN201 TaxID=2710755 RepID=UPI0013C5430C|nr:EAL domain-containing protein [Wenzhouxiangella sp. XN201]NEZ02973.1 EAL domain-containing protein [Wenzhouxiangella sp. XN201]